MTIEREILKNQSAQISCMTDDLNKLTRKISTAISRITDSTTNDAIYGINAMLIHFLSKSISIFALILDSLPENVASSLTAPDAVPDNLVTLAQSPHSAS